MAPLKRNRRITRTIRAVCRKRVGKSLGALHESNHLEAIHTVRKEIKKMRSLLRLIGPAARKRSCRRALKTFKATADRLGAVRDAQVGLQALEHLDEKFRPEHSPRSFWHVKRELSEDYRRRADEFLKRGSARRVEVLLKKALKQAGRLKVKPDGQNAIRFAAFCICRRRRFLENESNPGQTGKISLA